MFRFAALTFRLEACWTSLFFCLISVTASAAAWAASAAMLKAPLPSFVAWALSLSTWRPSAFASSLSTFCWSLISLSCASTLSCWRWIAAFTAGSVALSWAFCNFSSSETSGAAWVASLPACLARAIASSTSGSSWSRMSLCLSSFLAFFCSLPFSVFRSPALVSSVAFSASSRASWASSSSAECCSDSAPVSPWACSSSSWVCRLWALAYCFSN